MKFIISCLLLGLALSASVEYHQSMLQMRRALANQVNYQTGSSEPFPAFDPKSIDGWESMTPQEQEQVKQIYKEFEKLAHLMDDWAKEFDADMSKFDTPQPAAKTSKPVSTPAASAKNGRQDTGSRSNQGWRNLQEGTNRYQYDAFTTDGKRNYGID